MPAFLSANVADVLVKNFGISGIDSVEGDMEKFFQIAKEMKIWLENY